MKLLFLHSFLGILFLGISKEMRSQQHELGVGAGLMLYRGDFSLNYKQELKHSSFSYANLNYQYLWGKRFTLRSQLAWGQIRGDDQYAEDNYRRQRNLNFHTNIVEFSLMPGFNFLPFDVQNQNWTFTPYIMAGIAAFYYNPKTIYNEQVYTLREIGTEGQGLDNYTAPYSIVDIAIPLSAGIKFGFSQNIVVGIEVNVRKTFTDYLDDTSGDYVPLDVLRVEKGELSAQLSNRVYDSNGLQIEMAGKSRGTLAREDWYYSLSLQLSYIFSSPTRSEPKGLNAQIQKSIKRKLKKHDRWF